MPAPQVHVPTPYGGWINPKDIPTRAELRGLIEMLALAGAFFALGYHVGRGQR